MLQYLSLGMAQLWDILFYQQHIEIQNNIY